MILCNFMVRLEIPDDISEERQFALLDQVDKINLIKSITEHTANRLSKNGIPNIEVTTRD